MVSTIGPLVKAASSTWAGCAAAFTAASMLAAAMFGALIGAIGHMISSIAPLASPALVGVAALACALIELRALPVTSPYCARSVPQDWWRRYPPTYAAIAYGAVLGVGVTTVIPFAAFYFVLSACLLAGPIGGAMVLSCYGLGRALPLLGGSVAILYGLDVREVAEWPINKRRHAHALCAAALVVVAAALIIPPILAIVSI